MPDTILAFDIGLTNSKTVVFGAEGQILAHAAVRYATPSPQPGYAEQHPEDCDGPCRKACAGCARAPWRP